MNLILDGANIARQGVDSSGNGNQLRAAIDRLLADGHTLYPVLAQFRMSGKRAFPNMEWVDAYKVHDRVNFVQAPSGTDDDSFILDLAIQLKGVVVSNDLFRDHKERLGKQASRYCGGSKATHRMMYSIAGDLFVPDPNFKMPAEEKAEVPQHAIQVPEDTNSENSSSKHKSQNQHEPKSKNSGKGKSKKGVHRITKGTVKSAIIQHADLPMAVSKLGTYIPTLIAKSTGRKVTKRELRDEAGFGNNSWIEIFSRMGPEIQVDRNSSPPIVNIAKKEETSNQKRPRNKSKSKNLQSSESLDLTLKEFIEDGRYRLASEKSLLSSLLPFLKVDEILVIPWSILCEKHLKNTGQRLSKLSTEDFSNLLAKVSWPLEGKRTRIVRHMIRENELHLWGR